MFVRMNRTFDYDAPDGTRRRIPAGWQGDLDDKTAQNAIDGSFGAKIDGDKPDEMDRTAAARDVLAPTAGTVKPEGEPGIEETPRARTNPDADRDSNRDGPARVGSDFRKFDRDDDGRPGGSRPRASEPTKASKKD